MRLRFICIWIFALAASIILISGASRSYAVHELFKHVDENADGKINKQEFSDDMKKHAFEKLDENNNEAITESEWVHIEGVVETKMHQELFKKIDKDKDNRISFFEFSDYADGNANLEEAFMGLDRNGNNNLSPDELTVRPLFKMITIRF